MVNYIGNNGSPGFKNYKGEVYSVGDICYYIVIIGMYKFQIRRNKVKSFYVNNDGVYIHTKYNTININSVYKSKQACEEAIKQWEKDNIKVQLIQSIKKGKS